MNMEIPNSNSLERKDKLMKAIGLYFDALEGLMYPNNRGPYLKIFQDFKQLMEKGKINLKELKELGYKGLRQEDFDNLEDWLKTKKE